MDEKLRSLRDEVYGIIKENTDFCDYKCDPLYTEGWAFRKKLIEQRNERRRDPLYKVSAHICMSAWRVSMDVYDTDFFAEYLVNTIFSYLDRKKEGFRENIDKRVKIMEALESMSLWLKNYRLSEMDEKNYVRGVPYLIIDEVYYVMKGIFEDI